MSHTSLSSNEQLKLPDSLWTGRTTLWCFKGQILWHTIVSTQPASLKQSMIKATWNQMKFSRENDITESKTLCGPQPDILKKMAKGAGPQCWKNNTQPTSCWVGLLFSSLGQGTVSWLAYPKPFVAQRVGPMGREREERTHHGTETQDVVRRRSQLALCCSSGAGGWGPTSGKWQGQGDP